jgi:hypothetical protein
MLEKTESAITNGQSRDTEKEKDKKHKHTQRTKMRSNSNPTKKSEPHCFYIEMITTIILQSSSRTGWSLRNIHFSNGNWSFLFLVEFSFFPLSPTRRLLDVNIQMYEYHGRCFIRNRNCLLFESTWVHLRFCGGVRVAPHFGSLCVFVTWL